MPASSKHENKPQRLAERDMNWLPDMDLNHDKQIQSLLCYRYTIGQTGAATKLKGLSAQSSRQTAEAPLAGLELSRAPRDASRT